MGHPRKLGRASVKAPSKPIRIDAETFEIIEVLRLKEHRTRQGMLAALVQEAIDRLAELYHSAKAFAQEKLRNPLIVADLDLALKKPKRPRG